VTGKQEVHRVVSQMRERESSAERAMAGERTKRKDMGTGREASPQRERETETSRVLNVGFNEEREIEE
jgi:hypothetical protein